MIPKDNLTLHDFIPGSAKQGEEFRVVLGLPHDHDLGLSPKQLQKIESNIIDAIKTVHDPEIPVNIYDLGLIVSLNVSQNVDVMVSMTLTSPACPVAGELPRQVAQSITKVDQVGRVSVELTWDTPWTRDRMSEDAKLLLDL